ncbi:MAG TPA: arginase [Ktedonobacterales bacterium]|nr:arginase [Ktedonobacterales bacterium]
MNIHIIGAPIDLGAGRRGVDMGPSAIRYAGLGERLGQLGYTIIDEGNIAIPPPETFPIQHPHLKYLDPILVACEELVKVVARSSGPDDIPLVIGGDHSLALGSITGAVKARGSVGVIWIDAHADFNTDHTTPSGNIHGMPLAALAGFGDERLVNIGGFHPKISPAHIAIVAARDLDPGERGLLHEQHVHVFTMKDIDHLGLPETLARALEIATSNTNGLHVSFDMDSMDPREAPGVGTPVRGGITYREAHLAMELIADADKLTSMDVVEVNPILDQENRTANLAVELILSAFGKRIF